MGTQVKRDVPDAHQGYPGVDTGVLSSGGGGVVRTDREEYRERWVKCQGKSLMRPLSGTKRNIRGDRVMGTMMGERKVWRGTSQSGSC